MERCITALVIIHYNDFTSTRNLLDNVKNYKSLDYVLVVDNCSTDDSFDKLLKFTKKKVEVVRTSKNNGYSAAINYGCKYLIEKFGKLNLIISNSDVIINKDEDIKRLSMVLDSNSNYAIVAPVILENKSLNSGWFLLR